MSRAVSLWTNYVLDYDATAGEDYVGPPEPGIRTRSRTRGRGHYRDRSGAGFGTLGWSGQGLHPIYVDVLVIRMETLSM